MRPWQKNFQELFQRIVWLGLLLYVGYVVGLAIYENYQSHQKIKGIENDIADLKSKINRQSLLNLYYQSDTFKELEARRRLGLKRPGEKVFILPKQTEQEVETEIENISSPARRTPEEPNWRQWIRVVLGV